MLQLKQQLSRSSPSLALQNLPAGLQISVQGTTDPLSKQPSLVVQLLQPEGLAGNMKLPEGGRKQELPPQGTSSQQQVGFDCAPLQELQVILVVPALSITCCQQHTTLSDPQGPSRWSSQQRNFIG